MDQYISPYRKGQLTRLRTDLREMENTLDWMHGDRSGAFLSVYRVPPHLRADWKKAADRITWAEELAASGCEYAVQWLLDTAELRARVEYLNNKPLAPRDPDYEGPVTWPFRATRRDRRSSRLDAELLWNDDP